LPDTVKGWRADVPITKKIVWLAVNDAAKRAGIGKHIASHLAALLRSRHAESRHRLWHDLWSARSFVPLEELV
jgi:ribosomal protein S18 acetylase RimI-like enzyme